MNISEIKSFLAAGDIPADKINPMIKALKEEGLNNLSQPEREYLCGVFTEMLLLIQDPNSGAHLDEPEKAESLISAILQSIHSSSFKRTATPSLNSSVSLLFT